MNSTIWMNNVYTLVGSASKCIDKLSKYENQLCQAVSISCPRDHVIYRPNVTASDQSCASKVTPCDDRTIDLVVSVSECYWKPSCVINFPTTHLLSCGNIVESLHVNSWQCVDTKVYPKTYIGYMCDGAANFGPAIERGMIRSHHNFPWKYDVGTFKENLTLDKSTGELKIECTKTINLRDTDEQFLVTVDSLSIDKDNDDLTINGKMLRNRYNTIFTSADNKIQFNFKLNPTGTKGGSGFVICFKKLQKGEIKDGMSACDDFMTTTYKPIKETRSSNIYCPKRGVTTQPPIIGEQGQDDLDEACDNIRLLYHSTAMPELTTIQHPQSSTTLPAASEFCVKCLSRPKVGKKCKRNCCKGRNVSSKCSSNGSIVPGKCTIPKRKLNRMCKSCETKTKCRKKFIKRCKVCCVDRKNNLSKCRKPLRKVKRKRLTRKQRRARRKKRKQKRKRKH